MSDCHSDQRLEAVIRAYEIQIEQLNHMLETYRDSMARILTTLEAQK